MIINAIIVLASQILFLFFRTLNIKYTSRDMRLGAVLSGMGIGLCWLTSIKMSIDAINDWDPLTIGAYFIGGATGTWIGMSMKKKPNERA